MEPTDYDFHVSAAGDAAEQAQRERNADREDARFLLALAQVHATLALAAATKGNDIEVDLGPVALHAPDGDA